MKNIKAKLERYLNNEMKASIDIKEGFEQRYKQKCKDAVIAIVNKTYEVLIRGECIQQYETQPDEFLKRELPEYSLAPCNNLITELFENYSTELFEIFETDLLDTIQEIKTETRNNFVINMLGYIHTAIIRNYKAEKNKIIDNMEFFDTVRDYNCIIGEYISLIKKEIYSDNENGICYKTFIRHLEDTIDELIAELRRYVNHWSEDFHKERVRYIYYYIEENILAKF